MTEIEFEQIIIKTIYANPEVSGKIIPELDTGWFTNVDHKYIVNAIWTIILNFPQFLMQLKLKDFYLIREQ